MCRRNFLFPEEAEAEVAKIREAEGIDEKTEKLFIKEVVKNAKVNSRIGDKVLICINPIYIHYPEWQREIRLPKALSIGANYDSKRWGLPVFWHHQGLLWAIEGQHRDYGAVKAKKDAVVGEVIECDLKEAIDLFVNQTRDRTQVKPKDTYKASIVGGDEDYLMLRDICHKHNLAVKGDRKRENTIGTLTSITDGIDLIRMNPDLLDHILSIITTLGWNGYADSYNGKAYTAKVIRAIKALYAYCDGRTDEMEAALIKNCKGTEFFVDNIMEKTQAQIFDYLSNIARYEMESPFRNQSENTTKKASRKKMA
nr:MAG TPA: hypothetical protein [Caudoviricetes sp.]